MDRPLQSEDLPKAAGTSISGSQSLVTTAQKENLHGEDHDLSAVFDKHLNYQTVPIEHDRTIVQLVSWEENYDDLKTKHEVDDLKKVFEEDYHFEVRESVLDPKGLNHIPQGQLIRDIMDMIVQKESEKTLLILYYAGHGWHEESGTLYLAGNSSQRAQAQKDRNSIAWHSVEMCFKFTPADVLVIFDCCYAGALRGSYRSNHSCFEFLGACGAEGRTPPPGDKSFTRALINALGDLKAKGGFDSAELEQAIRRFAVSDSINPINPMLFPRKEPSPDHVWIAPLTPDGGALPTSLLDSRNKHLEQRPRDRPTECVDVRFHFTKSQKHEEIAQLALALRRFVKDDGPALSLGRVSFLNKTSLFQNVALRWREISSLVSPSDAIEQDGNEDKIRTIVRQEVQRRDSELVETVNRTAWWNLFAAKGLLSGALVALFLTHRLFFTHVRAAKH